MGLISTPVAPHSALREPRCLQPARHCFGPDSNLLCNGKLGVTLAAEFYHGPVSLVACLPASPAPRFDQCESLSFIVVRRFLSQFCSRGDLKLLDVPFHRLGQITHQMIAVGDLHRRRRALSPAICIQAGPITCDDLDLGMRAKPSGKAAGRSVRQQVNHTWLLQVHQHRPVALLLAPSPIVHAQYSYLRLRPAAYSCLHSAQHRVRAPGHTETIQKSRSGKPTKRIPDQTDDLAQTSGLPCSGSDDTWQTFRKDLPIAVGIAATKTPRLEANANLPSLPRQIPQVPLVLAYGKTPGNRSRRDSEVFLSRGRGL